MYMDKKTGHPKKELVIKFILLCFVLIGYFIYLNIEYDVMTSGVAAILTWSFFVLCTPIADAGFLLDFPIRLIFGVRMMYSEICVWIIAILINLFSLIFFFEYYSTTPLLKVFYAILLTPYPYWGIILLSALGTFLSIRFGDEMMDVLSHEKRKFFHKHCCKHEIIVAVVVFTLIFVGYYELISSLGIVEIIDGG